MYNLDTKKIKKIKNVKNVFLEKNVFLNFFKIKNVENKGFIRKLKNKKRKNTKNEFYIFLFFLFFCQKNID